MPGSYHITTFIYYIAVSASGDLPSNYFKELKGETIISNILGETIASNSCVKICLRNCSVRICVPALQGFE